MDNMDMTMDTSNESANMGMGGVDGSQMVMTFFVSSTTSLFSKSWTPKTSEQYAGTCIFLITLAVIMRVMLALKPILEKSLWNATAGLDGELIPDDETCCQKEDIRVQSRVKRVYGAVRRRWTAWRFRTSLGRAIFELLLASVGYLLMLAVMTMNVGYFLAVLGGLFLGTFIVGDLAADNSLYQDHHC
ncbi:Ctr copper transporter family-domain-containing protein [Hypoxylon trugodes]|uniref:Ctr copper transporter family-domain-containing protein n=1 Tax=Hypoxylon trugodes TaxID=326681 RepID=UPI00218FE8AA|nr:Ctr copper transporter family-domain-containing protein [Hypoxylon trugodes]KAI1382623.1 Ctr copper transporter family-domain-containing protein [Hypoxylon trugodes]